MDASIRALAHGALALILSSGAYAGTLHVATNGIDTAVCSQAAPCRSITRALAVARSGDTVLVRPGRYGDADGDGIFASPGDEIPSGFGTVRVAKPVKVLSTDGAALTIIDGGTGGNAAVELASNGITFGAVGQGFTVTGGQFYALLTDGFTNVRISGNIVTGANSFGLFANSAGVVEVSDNIVHGNVSDGIIVSSLLDNARVLVRRNQVYSNGTGIQASTFGPHDISFNEVSNNAGTGIVVAFGPSIVYRNTVVGNERGIAPGTWSPDRPPAVGPQVVRNTVIGNSMVGLFVTDGPVRMNLRENNVYGNGQPTGFFANCGVANFTGAPLSVPNTYWGAATGPGADPADTGCGNDPVIATPFATRPN